MLKSLVRICAASLAAVFLMHSRTVMSDESKVISLDLECRNHSGQVLILPPPADQRQFDANDAVAYFERFRPAGIFLQKYQFDATEMPRKSAQAATAHYIYQLRLAAQQAGIPPILVFADYERITDESGSSFQASAINIPRSAMQLTATSEPALVQAAGLMDGRNLRNLGIDAIFGPVLDVDRTSQGGKSDFEARMYSDVPNVVANVSFLYSAGLIEAGLLLFPKHFPGYGSVEGSTERLTDSAATSNASMKVAIEDLSPFREHLGIASGFMTSHAVNVSLGDTVPGTLSRTIEYLVRKETVSTGATEIAGFEDQEVLLVTDDVSQMGGVSHYLRAKGLLLGDFVVGALKAGHSLVLVAHQTEKRNSKLTRKAGEWPLPTQISTNLIERCSQDQMFRKKLKEHAARVIALKDKAIARGVIPYDGNFDDYSVVSDFGKQHPGNAKPNDTGYRKLATNSELDTNIAEAAMFGTFRDDISIRNGSFVTIVSGSKRNSPLRRATDELKKNSRLAKRFDVVFCDEPPEKARLRYTCLKEAIKKSMERGDVIATVLADGDGRTDSANLMEYAASIKVGSPEHHPVLIGIIQTSPRYISPKALAEYDGFMGNLSGDYQSNLVALSYLLDPEMPILPKIRSFPLRMAWAFDQPESIFANESGSGALKAGALMSAILPVGTRPDISGLNEDLTQEIRKTTWLTNLIEMLIRVISILILVLIVKTHSFPNSLKKAVDTHGVGYTALTVFFVKNKNSLLSLRFWTFHRMLVVVSFLLAMWMLFKPHLIAQQLYTWA